MAEIDEENVTIGAKIDEKIAGMQEKMTGMKGKMSDKYNETKGQVNKYISENPMKAVLIASAVGFVTGVALSRRRNHNSENSR